MPNSNVSPFILIGAAVIAMVCLVVAFHFYRRRHLIDDTPTSKTQGVFIGLSELKGTAESETPLESYLAAARCVWYSYRVEEHYVRTSVDAKGRPTTHSGWESVEKGSKSVPVFLKDDTGVIRVLPGGAEVHGQEVFKKEVKRDDPLYYGKGPDRSISGSTHRRRFIEEAIPLHTGIYVIGQARVRTDAVAAEIAASKGSLFIVSVHPEKQHSDIFRVWYWLWLGIGLVAAMVGAGVYFSQTAVFASIVVPVVFAAFIYGLAAFIGWVWTAYNSLVNLRARVRQGFSQIDVELKRRADLIPNLVAAVEGYRAHESGLQQLAAELRNQQTLTMDTRDGELKGLAARLSIVAEKYPDLKASQSFLALQTSLSETEQRLALARDYYNSIATFYRTRLEIFPDGVLGRLLGFKPMALLEAATFERAPVEVNLAE
ncbi:LemA family protein [Dehalogenimonas etheniformans]|nr:LemA family protein [Dehalogenimonas etheniformans]